MKKLYRVILMGLNGSDHKYSFVVSDNSESAYKIVRDYLDKCNYGSAKERCLKSVELFAEHCAYPECRTRLFIEDKEISGGK